MRSRFVRRITIIAAAAVTVGEVAVVPASLAHATGGTGYAMQWLYDSPGAFTYAASLPGASVSGFGWDDNFRGARGVEGWFQDTDPNDGQCADVWFYGSRGTFHPLQACNGQGFSFQLPTDLSGTLTITILTDAGEDNFIQSAWTTIPDPAEESSIENTGNGVSWSYDSPTNVHFELQRESAHLSGDATHEGNPDFRTVSGTVSETAPTWCVYASVTDGYSAKLDAGNRDCGSPDFRRGGMRGWLTVQVCEKRPGPGGGPGNGQDPGPGHTDPCVTAVIPQPL